MQDNGQVYADLFGDAPLKDRERMEQALDKLEREEIEKALLDLKPAIKADLERKYPTYEP